MVLAELGNKITNALRQMNTATVIDEAAVDSMLKEIGNALVLADVNVPMVARLKANIKKRISLEEIASGLNKRKIIKQAVFDALIELLDPGVKPFKPVKGKSNVLMFVGLQGSGKTTTVTKLAYYYKKNNYTTAMVCADTFRAGAIDQLGQNAAKAKIPYYGSYTETDPVRVAQDGVETFKKEGTEIIIVDTSGRHKQEAELFEEMQQIANAVKPDNIIFVMDSSIGQAAHDQAVAFKSTVKVGSVIMTKMDGHAKGGGALSAVATTQSPIIFLGTGEQIPDLEMFDPRTFVSRLLGMGDIQGMMKLLEEAMPADSQPALAKRLQEGKFSLRDMYDQFQNIMKMGPLDKVMQMVPGFSNMPQLQGADGNAKLKAYITIMDSMTDQELDNAKVLNASRIARIARGSGRRIQEVNELLVQYKQFEKIIGTKGLKNMNPNNMRNMANMLPPQVMQRMGGPGAIQQMMRQMQSGNFKMPEGFPGFPGFG
jgi:signal recognition particle subunit SRP54